jgi:glyoxylase-like metal-dependent hydrolase (beta-lactamase superfamily II)
MLDCRVISIGALSRNNLWEERVATRTAHSTTTLVRSGEKSILVDPGLPAQVLEARLAERAGISPENITDVFLTNFRPAHRRGLMLFPNANWWISEAEREMIGVTLVQRLEDEEDTDNQKILREEISLLQRCKAAEDRVAPQVDLFPLPGFTPGTCGLLLTLPQATVLIAGDAVPTIDHLQRGQVLPGGYDLEKARESFAEAVEIADWIIAGHDNLLPNMTRRTF